MLIVHADWSVSPKKRWAAEADRVGGRWEITAFEQVSSTAAFLRRLIARAETEVVIAGFDFPIGVPAAYGARTELADFASLLRAVGNGAWSRFSEIARVPAEISLHRPFYPAGSNAGIKQAPLIDALGVETLDQLRRVCERSTGTRRAACPLFWTLGGNQVGRAALAGWDEVLTPALAAGAALWPYAGPFETLVSRERGLLLTETYPAEAYMHVGIKFGGNESKRRRSDRLGKCAALIDWAEIHEVRLAKPIVTQIQDGFGHDEAGEDRFDALLGLFGMIEVADGRRASCPDLAPDVLRWEGWILGQGDTVKQGLQTAANQPSEIDIDHKLVAAVRSSNPATKAALRKLLDDVSTLSGEDS